MTFVHPSRYASKGYTWEKFRAAVRRVDRESLLLEAGAITAAFGRGEELPEWQRFGISPWTVADVARTSLAWGGPGRPRADQEALFRLCNMSALLIDEGFGSSSDRDEDSSEGIKAARELLARVLARTYFEQFPGQRPIFAEVARSILLFGSAADIPAGFTPQMMTEGWFENVTGGITFDDYVESVFLFSVITLQHGGHVPLDVLDSPALVELGDVFSLDAARRVFHEHLVQSVDDFKKANRARQDSLPSSERKFAFNPLTDKPFVEGVAPTAIAPWVQAVINKALPPSIYFLPPSELRKPFADDLGPIFQHYAGRQLAIVDGPRLVHPEVEYRKGKSRIDSCDWFLDLPNLLVLIECKARQPIESLRVGGTDWLHSIEDSIGKGIRQLNRSHAHIESIGAERPEIDIAKPRVGIVVTLEPFYLNQNWLIRERLDQAELPTGVLSIGELEALVLLNATELGQALAECAEAAEDNVMLLNPVLNEASGRENPLLVDTWESIGLFARINQAAARLGIDPVQDAPAVAAD